MIHLDTNILIDLVTADCPHLGPVRRWLADGVPLVTSAVAWSEFCNGPHSRQQKDAVFAILGRRISDFTWQMGEQASRLFHTTGRRRGSHADCMIAAAAMLAGCPVATRNIADFEKFRASGLDIRSIPTVS